MSDQLLLYHDTDIMLNLHDVIMINDSGLFLLLIL